MSRDETASAATKPAISKSEYPLNPPCHPANTSVKTTTKSVNAAAAQASCKPPKPKTKFASKAASVSPKTANVATKATSVAKKTVNSSGKQAKIPQKTINTSIKSPSTVDKSVNSARRPTDITHKNTNSTSKSHAKVNSAQKPPESSTTSQPANIESPNFESMNVRDLKLFVRKRGITVTNVTKPNLVILAKAASSMNLTDDPDFENQNMEQCLNDRLTLPAGGKVQDPFTAKGFSNDLSVLPPFGLLDVFNHLILSSADYDKEKLASWRSFDERTLSQDGYVRSLDVKTVTDLDKTKYFLMRSEIIPTQKEKTQEGAKHYRLWFILSPNGTIYSAYCTCKGGSDQGCRHLGATLFELEDFLCNERQSVTQVPAYWNPKPQPIHQPIPLAQMKTSHSTQRKGKKRVIPYDDSWIDSFDPRPKRHRCDITADTKNDFAKKLATIDPTSAILHYFNIPPNQEIDTNKEPAVAVESLSICSKAKAFVNSLEAEISEDNVDSLAHKFLETLSYSEEERNIINEQTIGQGSNNTWHNLRHLMVTGKKIKALYTRAATIQKKPNTDVSKTVFNFLNKKDIIVNFPAAIRHGIEKEADAKKCYAQLKERQHVSFNLYEPGLMISESHPWLAASLDGIATCKCCQPRVAEFKAPYNGWEMDPKDAFLLDTVGGEIGADGQLKLKSNHLHYFQVQTQMAVRGLKTCDFVIFTSKGILIVEVNFDENFWAQVILKVSHFYTKYIIPALLLQFSKKNVKHSDAKANPSESPKSNTTAAAKQGQKSEHCQSSPKQPAIQSNCTPLKPEFGPSVRPSDVQQPPPNQSKQPVAASNIKDTNSISKSQSTTTKTKMAKKLICSAIKNLHNKPLKHAPLKQETSKPLRKKTTETDLPEVHDLNSKKFEPSCKRKIELSEILEFLKRKDIILQLQDFVKSLKHVPKQFGVRYTFEIGQTLFCIDDDDHEEIMEEIYILFPNLNQETNISYAMSIVHELIQMYLKEVAYEL